MFVNGLLSSNINWGC